MSPKILVYGAGPLGSLFAARLLQAGHDVSLLARGKRLAQLRKHGLVLENVQTGEQSVAHPTLVEQLAPSDAYDLVLVIMRKNCAASTLPSLQANRRTPNVLFMMNNAAGPGEFIAALGTARVLVGFPSSAGYRKEHIICYLGGSAERIISIPFGEADGSITERTRQVAEVLASMPGYQAEIHTDMDAWLKTHVALLMPSLVAALYACGTDNYRLARTRDGVVLAGRAIREAFRVLQALGIPITPKGMKLFQLLPEPLLVPYAQRLLQAETMQTALVGHALAARDEIKYLADEFLALAGQTDVPIPNIELLSLLSTRPLLIPDGSAEIPLDWRSTAAALAGAAGFLALGALLAWALTRKRRS
jgi:2-dehydropantoate 2-reductase